MNPDNLSVLVEELDHVSGELQAVELQIQELLERQQELIERKSSLKTRIKKLSEEPEAEPSEESASEDWNKQDFPWSQKVADALRDAFQLDTFRSLQLETINATMAGKDVFLIMPTGGGKSLCYQLPALCSDGLTLVICPLVSLMEDQLMVLNRLGICATCLNASSTKDHVKWVHNEMIDKKSQLRLLYVTPEKIAKNKLFMSRLEKSYQGGRLTRFAVDEVHCCSQWGHDFRPDYKLLGILKRQFPNASLIGLTATATSHVLKDAQKILCISKPITFTASFNRPNLFYEVRQKPANTENFLEDVVKLINGRYRGQSGIIYCFSQKDSENVTMSLQKLGIRAGTYHSNMEPQDKTRVHTKWTENKLQVVVATVAFGMGIDKPDVRFVIHHSMSKSMENYYQESGRAGRDDQRADCILYYGFGDIFRISSMVVMENVGQQKLYDMVKYCLNLGRCRRVLIAQHFDEVWDSARCNKMCDNCFNETVHEEVALTSHSRDVMKILEQAEQMHEKLTPLKLVDAWMGKGAPKLRVAEVQPPKLPRGETERIIAQLILQQYLREDFSFTAYATISYMKKGPKAPLLQNKNHKIVIHMKKTSAGQVKRAEAASSRESPVRGETMSPPKMKRTSTPSGGAERKRQKAESSAGARTSESSQDDTIIID